VILQATATTTQPGYEALDDGPRIVMSFTIELEYRLGGYRRIGKSAFDDLEFYRSGHWPRSSTMCNIHLRGELTCRRTLGCDGLSSQSSSFCSSSPSSSVPASPLDVDDARDRILITAPDGLLATSITNSRTTTTIPNTPHHHLNTAPTYPPVINNTTANPDNSQVSNCKHRRMHTLLAAAMSTSHQWVHRRRSISDDQI
jgi:hypothetical protein